MESANYREVEVLKCAGYLLGRMQVSAPAEASDIDPCELKRSCIAEQNSKYSILDSQPRVRLFSLECAQLLTERKELEAEVAAGSEECAEAGEEADEKWNHEFGFIA